MSNDVQTMMYIMCEMVYIYVVHYMSDDVHKMLYIIYEMNYIYAYMVYSISQMMFKKICT